MKSDSERQVEYQRRRLETHDRIVVWVSKEVEHGVDVLRARDGESRMTWINRAITELTIRQLLGKKFVDIYNDTELEEAQRRGRDLGIIIPN